MPLARRTWRLLRLLRAAPAAAAALALAAGEAAIVARVGTISGRFYSLFVDSRRDQLPGALAWAAGLYLAAAAFLTLKAAFQEWLALAWRRRLAARLHRLYCLGGGGRSGAAEGTRLWGGPLAPPYYAVKGASVDSPDQRMAQDLPFLCTRLSDVLCTLCAAPVGVATYTHLTVAAFGSWAPVAAAAAFFAAGAVLQRAAMAPVARLVFSQEAAEGALRFGHMRIREWAEEIAFYRGGPAELAAVNARLAAALDNQRRLVWRHAALTLVTKGLDYGGAMLNYACLAAAVFGGAWVDGGGGDAGSRAGRISVASFYLLMLIYSFTQVLDLADKGSDLAGLVARVGQLLEFLEGDDAANGQSGGRPPGGSSDGITRSPKGKPAAAASGALASSSSSRGSRPAAAGAVAVVCADGAAPSGGGAGEGVPFVTLLWTSEGDPRSTHASSAWDADSSSGSSSSTTAAAAPLRPMPVLPGAAPARARFAGAAAALLVPPRATRAPCGAPLEVSLHSAGDAGPLRDRIAAVFPDAPRGAPLLLAVTFQSLRPAAPVTGDGAAGAAGDAGDAEEMGRLLGVFLRWEGAVRGYLAERGYWSDAVDPRTGRALHSHPGDAYNEVTAAEVLLGYVPQSIRGAACPMITHPTAGSRVYPATFAAAAPAAVLRAAIEAAAAAASAAPAEAEVAPQQHSQHYQQQHKQQQEGKAAAPAGLPQLAPAAAWPAPAVLTVRGMCLSTPAGVPIVKGLGFQLPAGGSLLITGPTGAGKTTLLRALAGLRPADAGAATLPAAAPRGGTAFVPQRPLAAPAGCGLLCQAAYPLALPGAAGSCGGACDDGGCWCGYGAGGSGSSSIPRHDAASVLQALDAVGLGYLQSRLWQSAARQQQGQGPPPPQGQRVAGGAAGEAGGAAALSPGELQRLAFARLLLARPSLALLDEPTSALPASDEAALLGLLAARGVAIVTVGHRRSLAALHRLELAIFGDGGGGWELRPTGADGGGGGGCAGGVGMSD